MNQVAEKIGQLLMRLQSPDSGEREEAVHGLGTSEGDEAIAGLVLGGLILLFTIPVNLVMAQDLVPTQAGTVSALMMGFAWGAAGLIFIPLTGRMADLFSLHTALLALLAFPILGFFLSLRLPK